MPGPHAHPATGESFAVPGAARREAGPATRPTPRRRSPPSPDDVVRLAGEADLDALQAASSVCRACPRLVAWREEVAVTKRRAYADEPYWGRPVPSFGDPAARLLVVGLAPGAHGANRTGRLFTGDRSGDWIVAALHRAGLATQPTSVDAADGLALIGARMVAPVRCVPPDNKPSTAERHTCAPWLRRELALLPDVRAVLALGAIGWAATLAAARDAGWSVPRPAATLRPRRDGGADPPGRGAGHPRRQLPRVAAEHLDRAAHGVDARRGGRRRVAGGAATAPHRVTPARQCPAGAHRRPYRSRAAQRPCRSSKGVDVAQRWESMAAGAHDRAVPAAASRGRACWPCPTTRPPTWCRRRWCKTFSPAARVRLDVGAGGAVRAAGDRVRVRRRGGSCRTGNGSRWRRARVDGRSGRRAGPGGAEVAARADVAAALASSGARERACVVLRLPGGPVGAGDGCPARAVGGGGQALRRRTGWAGSTSMLGTREPLEGLEHATRARWRKGGAR